jgi:ketosteroid isomerase-like protein
MALADPNIVQKMYQCLAAGDLEALRNQVFTPDVTWDLPGRSVLAGVKQGVDEVLAFLGVIGKSGLQVELLEMHAITEDQVIETHRVFGEVPGARRDGYTATVYRIRDGRIAGVNDYVHDQHEADHYFNAVFALKPIPDRLAY